MGLPSVGDVLLGVILIDSLAVDDLLLVVDAVAMDPLSQLLVGRNRACSGLDEVCHIGADDRRVAL